MPYDTAAIADLAGTLAHLQDRIRLIDDAFHAIDHETRRLDGPTPTVLAHVSEANWTGNRAEQFRDELARLAAAVVAPTGTSVVGQLEEVTRRLRSRREMLVSESVTCQQALRAAQLIGTDG